MASTITYAAMSTDSYYYTGDITSSTNKRDVSQMLDLITAGETPFTNMIGWGAESGGLIIEWVSEHLGWGYVQTSGVIASNATTLTVTSSGIGMAASDAARQVQEGTMLYIWSSTDAEHALAVVESVTDATITFAWLTTTYETSMEASQKLWIVGAFANEGSVPRKDPHRLRSLLSNKMTILREDVNLTGSMQATDMHAVANELRHQTRMRAIELARNQQKAALLSVATARTTTESAMMDGVLGFLVGQSGSHIDNTTRVFSESTFNTVVAACWNNGATPNSVWGSSDQMRKFTSFDRSRMRMGPDNRTGGAYISRYMTDVGIEVSLHSLRHFPPNLLFVLDTSKIKLRAKRGRKMILEKLGKSGDFDQWQLISEFSMEMRGYNQGQHGAFLRLS